MKSFFFPFLLLALLLGITRPVEGVVVVGENELSPSAGISGDFHEELNSRKQFGEEFHELKVARRRRLSLTKEWHFAIGDERIFHISYDKGRRFITGFIPPHFYITGRHEFLHRYTPF